MNYIRQLNAAFELFYSDDRLNPNHISLYMALFQEWNSSRFADTFFINRREMMNAAKIGSKTSYHRCVRDLDQWKYLAYFPSNNPFKGSKIRMTIFETADEPVGGHYRPGAGQLEVCRNPIEGQPADSYRPRERQLVVPSINNTKQENFIKGKRPAHQKEVIEFFKNRSCEKQEALTFFNHYQAVGWKMGNGSEILDWYSAAEKWILNLQNRRKNEQVSRWGTSSRSHWDHLRTTKNKDYDEPL
ncbi:hypothetical protein RM553_05025 [Zunongwangia sp. F363]|uniref:Transcriptional regulator n=1 Tax=Autumnicola tepida TaxID=3075595 RepID=A0ABU3C7Y7_9FLAO|nr:hypothetical protein [Zunongwangia sp. F363]MDT0642190.1 hypothetical protein [Zunongwangia sp. F363]